MPGGVIDSVRCRPVQRSRGLTRVTGSRPKACRSSQDCCWHRQWCRQPFGAPAIGHFMANAAWFALAVTGHNLGRSAVLLASGTMHRSDPATHDVHRPGV